MKIHEVAKIFPRMSDGEFNALVEDIQEHGVQQPILVTDGKIIDGLHRWEACEKLGIECPTGEWDGKGSLLDVVISLNLKRRHLNQSQAAAVAVEALPLYEAEAKERQGTRTDIQAQMPESQRGQARDHAARAMNVSPRYVEDAKDIRNRAPKQFEAIKRGETTVTKAKSKLRRRDRISEITAGAADMPEIGDGQTRYAVICADPPWRYEHIKTESRAIENQYPTLSLDEIQALEPPAAADAILFLWATSPKLAEALTVIEAWGFTYRTCMVWVKDKIGMGYYARQKHELLLIGARGALPTPEPSNRPPSVIAAPRRKHSAKPDEFYKLIEAMYPEFDGLRMEMFARKQRDGWESWGFEA